MFPPPVTAGRLSGVGQGSLQFSQTFLRQPSDDGDDGDGDDDDEGVGDADDNDNNHHNHDIQASNHYFDIIEEQLQNSCFNVWKESICICINTVSFKTLVS